MFKLLQMTTSISQTQLIYQYFLARPNIEVPHAEVVDWSTQKWIELTGDPLRDPDRAIRSLHQKGALVKISNGVYKYDPEHVVHRALEDFTEVQKRAIRDRDGNKCVICGKGPAEGVVLHVDHIKPKDLGGQATIENGQTLCAQHNFLKKNYSQNETGKRVFLQMGRRAREIDDNETLDFITEILAIYDKYDRDSHIK